MHTPRTRIQIKVGDSPFKEKVFENIIGKVTTTVTYPSGDKKVYSQPFKSYVGNFGRILCAVLGTPLGGTALANNSTASDSYMKIRAINNSTYDLTTLTNSLYRAIVNEGTKTSGQNPKYGIFVGNTNQSNSNFDGQMGNNIADTDYFLRNFLDDTADSYINYGATTVTLHTNILTVKRRITNKYSTAITVNEVGLLASSEETDKSVLIARDIYSTPIEIPLNGIVDIEYNFVLTNEGGYTLQYLNILNSWFISNSVSLKDITGATKNISFGGTTPFISAMAPAGNSNYGIVVGNGTVAQNYSSYQLTNKIAHSDTELSYGDTALLPLEYSSKDSRISFGFQRSFTNNSSADIVITEIGLNVNFDSTTDTQYLINRTLYNQTIEPDQILVIKYYLEFTVDPMER